MHSVLRSVAHGLVVGACAILSTSLHAGTIDRSTVTFGFGTGYSAVNNQTVSTVDDRTLLDGPGYLDTFFNVLGSGGSNVYTFNIAVKNLTASAVGQYHFRLGVSNQNHYYTIDSDGDSVPDYLDPDQDGDGIGSAMDNAPFVANVSQQDDDGDGWGNAIDLRPSDAGIPLNFLGGPKTAPFIVAPTGVAVFNSATGLGYVGSPSSDTFSNWMFVGSDLVFDTGSLAPDGIANFSLNIIVPDGLENDGFVLRQYSEAVPEPAALGTAGIGAILALVRRRRN